MIDPAALSLVDYAPFFDAAVDAATAEREARQGRARFKRKADEGVGQLAGDERVQGDGRVRAINRMLDSFAGYARSESQKRFHRAFVGACLPHIYGCSEFERHRSRVLEEHGLDKVQYEARRPRRPPGGERGP